MHTTSALYETIKSGNHTVRVILEIETVTNGTTEYVELDESKIYSLKTSGSVFPDEKPSIGNFCAREIDAVFTPPVGKTIPKQARMRIFTFLDNGTQQSERIPKGVFFIDTREYNIDKTKIMVHGFDAAVKFDVDINESDFDWPVGVNTLVIGISHSVGVQLANLDINMMSLLSNYIYKVPLTLCTKREMLRYIAACIGCNLAIDDEGKLKFLFLRIDAVDDENCYLSDENGDYITIGGDRIIVN